ncbi:DUF563 domain-containing protein [Pelomyxa schiedti]|nr:DUF563 domain-containing protein [Pelomyxa schiedti]
MITPLCGVWLVAIMCAFSGAQEPGITVQEIFARGVTEFNAGNIDGAIEYFTLVTKVAPEIPQAWTNLGVAYERNKMIEKAKEIYRECVTAINPTDITCHMSLCKLAFSTSMQLEDYRPCVQALQIAPDDPDALGQMGNLHVLLYQYAEAIVFLENSLQKRPNDRGNKFNLCLAYSREGRCEDTLSCSEELVQSFPSSGSYSALGVAASCCARFTKRGVEARTMGCMLKAEEVKTEKCPEGFKLSLDYSGAPHTATTILHGGESYGFDGTPRGLPYLIFSERQISIIQLQNVIMYATGSGLLSHGCTVFSGDHIFDARIVEEFGAGGLNENPEVLRGYGLIASAVQQNTGNYYHSLAETLGRIIILRDHLLLPHYSSVSAMGEVKGKSKQALLILPQGGRRFLQEAIDLIGLPPHTVIRWFPSNDNVPLKIPKLNIVDWRVLDVSSIQDSWLPFFPPRSVLRNTSALIRQAVASKSSTSASSEWRVVYISRGDAGVRTVDSEEDLISSLKQALGDHFIVFTGSGMSLTKQVETFANAVVIVGPHGAGFTNMMWAPPGATVILFPMEPVSDVCFGHMAAALGHDYIEVPQLTSYYYGHYKNVDWAKIQAVLDTVLNALSAKGLTPNPKTEL